MFYWIWTSQNSRGRSRMSMHCFFFLPTPFSVISHSSMDYCQVLRPILYFQPSPSQSDSWLYPTSPPPMPRRGSLALTLIPREAEDFPRGDNQSRHMPLPTYLDWLQPIYNNSRFGFIHVNIGKAFTCG